MAGLFWLAATGMFEEDHDAKDEDRHRAGRRCGAGLGWAHIGVIDALGEAGIVPDIVCGTSMGALVGGAYVTGNLEPLKQWALALDRRGIVSMIDLGVRGGGLVGGIRIVDWLSGLSVTGDMVDLGKSYAAVATDLTTGREVWVKSGALDEAIRVSIGGPGIFSPVEIDGHWLVDGGLVNPVPVSLCRALGADFIIAVNLNEDLLGRRLTREPAATPSTPAMEKGGNLFDLLKSLPEAMTAQSAGLNLFSGSSMTPGCFDVLYNAINIMQDHITHSRLAGDPPTFTSSRVSLISH